jgi:hypothetical protein
MDWIDFVCFPEFRIIKFFAWERSYSQKVTDIRNQELQTLRSSLFLRALALFFWGAAPILGMMLC